ncbi:aspartyl-phosphate phosphatase Spo0E family protein [Bacillus sp. ISL-40]|uniref:aspartyl-phosphate phosphatase Spo0E family protein n=1 Tax=unclassified Bacillus (in: firmicutes) TaxID=185979 RepID=UPI001BEC8F3B|nr:MULTISPECIES: aspartyl-phosphate phosphatase Spo0E family protein [unclassified Bacillus (in: firmicutes)]MBT2696018.1 aspartyl-phosphate phosphatase Spo0E family protein [Bacillus sp. ISL-40]MBT2719553.1 aspartyl-phosphate phosphatase Spo0E family protein [Bacillus sp. ISL-46]MBT2743908.1 aspartyl-phosphate phosphatase Spo0E family protein [Bacillus sp. ISL-77]
MRLEQCEAAIKEKKKEMIKLGMTKGLQNEETIYCSQELDKLLNEYNRLLLDDKHSKPLNPYFDLFTIFTTHVHRILSIPYGSFFI